LNTASRFEFVKLREIESRKEIGPVPPVVLGPGTLGGFGPVVAISRLLSLEG
jgi:hypothetical protein